MMTIAEPLSAGFTTMSLFLCSRSRAWICSGVRFGLYGLEGVKRLICCLRMMPISSISGGKVPGGGVKVEGILNLFCS